MAKEHTEMKHAGEHIVVQTRDRDTRHGGPKAWFDKGGTAIMLDAIYNEHRKRFNDELNRNLGDIENAEIEEVVDIVKLMAKKNWIICHECQGIIENKDKAASVNYADSECVDCAEDRNYCPESSDGSHDVDPSGHNSAQSKTTSECKHCGYTFENLPTG